MRRIVSFVLLTAACSAFASWSPRTVDSSSSCEQQLQCKAQQLVDGFLGVGHGHATVTVVERHGWRRSEATGLGSGVVIKKQQRDEGAGPADKRTYQHSTISEQMEVPRHTVSERSERWIERVGVAVIVDGAPSPQLQPLLECGLGLDPERDRVMIVGR